VNRRLSPEEEACAARLWREAGFAPGFQAAPIAGGANNRVYRLWSIEQSVLLKVYYRGDNDPRDRLGAEVAFTRFLESHGITTAPRPLAWDREQGMGLFEFIGGRKLTAGDVTKQHVLSALQFILQINEHRNSPDAAELPPASEACFSISEHLACVEQRVKRLAAIGDATQIDRETRRFVEHEVAPAWTRIREHVAYEARSIGMEDAALAPDDRCLSPSDFGFHNAMLTDDGHLRFFDFEYAGWDDPAKLVCDFFCQVEVPAPRESFAQFSASIVTVFPGGREQTATRIRLLIDVYRIKWCCILLNEFLPLEANRRRFSRGEERTDRKPGQLLMAREMLNQLEKSL
jgi:hypothetical protein